VGLFCWQQVGADRLNPTTGASSSTGDPTLNVDPTRAGVEPDIAFTGPGDTVPWVVWYEEGPTGLTGLRDTQQVFAAKAVADATPGVDGGFHWQAVGAGTAGQTNPLDTSDTNSFGHCASSQAAEDACSLNKVATANAENPRVAAGSLTPGGTTVPWVVWQEDVGGGVEAIFVARLVGGNHFELFNGGAPVSNTLNSSSRPDITFSNNEPYVSWHETVAGIDRLFVGHFEGGAATPAFVLDTPTGITSSPVGNVPDLRAPISSTCTSTPFSSDGASCRAGAAGTPFFLFTDGSSPAKLFGQAYAPTAASTGTATGVTTNGATVGGSVNPGGAVVNVHFDFGPTTAYGSTSPVQRIGPSTASQVVSAVLTGLPANTTFHFRVVAQSDFTTVAGDDATFTTPPTASPPSNDRPTSRIVGLAASVRARKLKRFHGTARDADDGVKRVDVALVQLLGGARAARKSCRALTSSGRLKRVAPVRGRCRPSIYLRAKGATKWSFTLRRRLPRGRYVLYSRATDKAGQRESGFKHGNRRAFRVR